MVEKLNSQTNQEDAVQSQEILGSPSEIPPDLPEAKQDQSKADQKSSPLIDPYEELRQDFFGREWMERHIRVLPKNMVFERFSDDSFIAAVTKSSETFLTSASADDQRHLAWASFYESIQEVPRAVQELSAIGNLNFEVVGYLYYRLGVLARKANQMDLAQACIQSAHRYYPDFGPIVIEWGLAEMAKGHRGQAITHFQTALRDKRIQHPYFFWVLIDQGLDDWVDECVDYDRMIHPEDPYLMWNLALAYETQGRYDRAVVYQNHVYAHPSSGRYDSYPWEAFERLAQKQISTLGLDQKLAGIGEDEPLSRAFWQAVKALYVKAVKPAMANKIEEILKMPL